MSLISALGFWNTSATRHTPVEDVQGIFSGSLVAALGLYVLASAGLLTGSTAGVAFLLHYAFGVNFGLAFFLLNLPFFYLSWKRLGMAFTVKTFIAIGMTSLSDRMCSRACSRLPASIRPGRRSSAACFSATACWRSIATAPASAASAFSASTCRSVSASAPAWCSLPSTCACSPPPSSSRTPPVVFYSVLGAVVLNLFLAINHRADRYIALVTTSLGPRHGGEDGPQSRPE